MDIVIVEILTVFIRTYSGYKYCTYYDVGRWEWTVLVLVLVQVLVLVLVQRVLFHRVLVLVHLVLVLDLVYICVSVVCA